MSLEHSHENRLGLELCGRDSCRFLARQPSHYAARAEALEKVAATAKEFADFWWEEAVASGRGSMLIEALAALDSAGEGR